MTLTAPSFTPLFAPPEVDRMVETRRWVHQHAEVAFEEEAVAAMVAERLRGMGLETTEGVGGHGVVAEIEGGRPGPLLMLRAETDALPIVEQTDVPFRSRNEGAMHACGHDAHVAIVLSVAEALVARAAAGELPGRVRIVFQPAEEVCAGAKAMVAAGAMRRQAEVDVDMVLALHLHGHMDVGTIGVCTDVATAATSDFTFVAKGRGGHGAFPEAAIDPVVAAGHVITALQTIIPREVPSTERAVLSVCTMQAGTAMNVIPESAELTGTVRSVDDGVHSHVIERAREVSEGVAASLRCEGSFTPTLMAPSVHNDPAMSAVVRAAAAEVVGPDAVLAPPSVMAGDDLAYFFEEARGCYFFVGAAYVDGRPQTTHHIPTWDIDERCIAIGAEVMLRAALAYLADPSAGADLSAGGAR